MTDTHHYSHLHTVKQYKQLFRVLLVHSPDSALEIISNFAATVTELLLLLLHTGSFVHAQTHCQHCQTILTVNYLSHISLRHVS